MGPKSDLDIVALLAREMRADLGATKVDPVFQEIRQTVRGYSSLPFGVIETGGAAATAPVNGLVQFQSHPELIRPASNTLFTSGTLGRYSEMLNAVMEAPGALYHDPHVRPVIEAGSGQLEMVHNK